MFGAQSEGNAYGITRPLRDYFDGCSTPDTDWDLCHQSAVTRPSTALRGTLLTGRNMLLRSISAIVLLTSAAAGQGISSTGAREPSRSEERRVGKECAS